MATLHLVGLNGPAGADRARITDVTLSVAPGEIVTLVGPSGAGKTTLLRLVAGLEPLASGRIELDGQRLDRLPTAERGIGLVTASGSLQPHMDVRANIGFPLRLEGIEPHERRRRVRAETDVLGLRRLLHRRPASLAAGEEQATALARETVRLPSVMLLDEPTSRLDRHQRARLRADLGTYLRGSGTPTLLATSDQVEAMSLGDRLAVLNEGRIVQVGPPQHVYDEPDTAFVAGFVGIPGANVLPGRIEVGRRTVQVRVGGGAWTLQPVTPALRRLDGTRVTVAARPEHLAVAAADRPGGVPGEVVHTTRLGDHAMCHVRLDQLRATIVVRTGRDAPSPGQMVRVVAEVARLRLFDASGDRRAAG